MSLPRPAKSSLPDPSYHWTTTKAQVFLGALADLGGVGEAARVVGMSRNSAYSLRKRLGEDSLFARMWDDARERSRAKRRTRPRKVTPLPPEDDVFGIGR